MNVKKNHLYIYTWIVGLTGFVFGFIFRGL